MANYRITSLLNLENVRKSIDPKNFKPKLYEYLLNEGEYIMKKAYSERDWNNQTYNLHDSYVAAVFDNGKCVGYRTLDPKADPSVGKSYNRGSYGKNRQGDYFQLYGREEAENFVMSYESSHTNEKGVKLVVAAVMFYADILERKLGRLKKKYKVISHVDGEFERLKSKGLTIPMKSYAGAPWKAIKIPSNVIRKKNVETGGGTFKGWK